MVLIAVLISCNQYGSSKESEKDTVVGTYTNGPVTRTYYSDGTIIQESPYGNKTYSWKVVEENSQHIKIVETQGKYKVIFYLYENYKKYPSKVLSCIKNAGSSQIKTYSDVILISKYALDSSDGCDGMYFKGSIK